MYVDTCKYSRNGKNYVRHLLRESFRVAGVVTHRTIANISHLPENEIAVLKEALSKKNKSPKQDKQNISISELENATIVQKAAFGALFVLNILAARLGFHRAFGKSKEAMLALWLVYARLLGCESRLAAAREARQHSVETILGLGKFDENNLYSAMDWLEKNQKSIEDSLNQNRERGSKSVFLYDVTSSYLEGTQNELADWGYNRDGKKGKMQIVIGLLTDANGDPLTVEVFDGNTSDTTTCTKKINEIKVRFNAENIVLVGDRGMIKQPQIDELEKKDEDFLGALSYITAITKPQIEKLLRDGVFQMSLFDRQVQEIIHNNIRYIIRRNPCRADEISENRDAKLKKLNELLKLKNEYLKDHKKAKPDVALNKINKCISKLKLSNWVKVSNTERTISLIIDQQALDDESKLDGCYVIKTDIKETDLLSAEQVHDLYKDLSQVEWAFRTFKSDLENRPIFVHKENRTRAHIFSVMLAYKLHRELIHTLQPHIGQLLQLLFDGSCSPKQTLTHADILKELDKISECDMTISGVTFPKISQPRPMGQKILDILKIKLPSSSSNPSAVLTTNNHVIR